MIRNPMVTLLVCGAMTLVLPRLAQAQEEGGRPGRRGVRHPEGPRRDRPGGQGFHRPMGPRRPGAGMPRARAVQRVDELLRLLDEQDAIREKIEAEGEPVPERLAEAAERIEQRTHELREGLRKALSARGFGRRGGPEHPPFEGGAKSRPGPQDRPGPPERPGVPDHPGPPRALAPGHPGGPPHGPDRPEAALRLLGDVAPEMAAELRQLWRENPDKARRRFHDALPEMARLRRLREDDPEAFERIVNEKRVEFRARRLARQARSAKGEAKERATAELRQHLNKLFEVRMRGRDARIEQLESELAKLRRDQERRRSHRDELIERRLQDLLGESLEF